MILILIIRDISTKLFEGAMANKGEEGNKIDREFPQTDLGWTLGHTKSF